MCERPLCARTGHSRTSALAVAHAAEQPPANGERKDLPPARSLRLEDVTRADHGIRRYRRQVSEQFGIVFHHLQYVLRFNVLVDVEGGLEDAQPVEPVFRTP